LMDHSVSVRKEIEMGKTMLYKHALTFTALHIIISSGNLSPPERLVYI